MLGFTESMNMEKSEGVRYSDEKPHMPESIDFSYTHTTKVSVGDDHGVNTPTNPKTPAAKGYIARQRVSISGLTSDASLPLNGKQVTLEEWIQSVQRWVVNVDERKDLVRVKPGKLELMRPGPDEPRYWPVGVHISELVFDIGSDAPVAMLVGREGFQGFGGFWGIKQNANRGLSPTKSFDQTSFSRER